MKLSKYHDAQHPGTNSPTYPGHSALATPDIILANGGTHHIHISHGESTCGDHIPQIVSIPTAAIVAPRTQPLVTGRVNMETIQINNRPLALTYGPGKERY